MTGGKMFSRCHLLSVSLAVLVCSLTTTTSGLAQKSAKPNIIYIVADDLGWKDVGFHGSDITTPNLDLLARDGVRLEQFYAQPMCTPTRAAFLTGRYPFRYGLQTMVIPASMTYGLPTDERLLSQNLKEAGYSTAIIGKWHLGHGKKEFWPMQRGFDYQYGALIGESITTRTPQEGKQIGSGTTSSSMRRAT
jgi:arylsulfatase A-like enzyme